MLEILDGRQFGTLITLITVYALFGDDMRLWLTSKPSDNIFYGLSAVAFAVFAFEFMTNSCFRPGFASPPSFYFWLDLLATLSLLPEIGWIWDPVQSYLEGGGATTSADLSAQIRAGRAARAGSKAGRVVRIVRLIRLVRVFKLYKHCRRARHLRQAQRDADQQDVSEHAGLVANGTARESTVEQPPLGAKGKGSPVVVGSSRRSARVAPERVNSGELHHVPSMRRAKLLVGPSQGAAGQPMVVTPTHSALAAQRKTEGGPESKAVAGVALVPSEETFAAGTNPPSGSRWSARSMGSGDAASSYAAPRRLDVATALPLAAAPTALDAAIAAQSEDPNEADTGAEVSGKQAHTISNVGIVLSDLTIRRVILLILVMLFVVPFLSTLDVSPSEQILGGLAQLHRYPQDVNITEDEFRFNAQMYSRHAGRVIYLAVCPETSTGCKHSRHVAVVHDWLSEMSFDEDGNQPRFPNGTAASSPYGLLTNPITGWMPSMLLDSEATILSLYRTVEVQAYTTSGCFGLDADGRTADDPERGPCESVVWLDDSVLTRYEASLSFVRTWFVMFVISIGAALFTRDAELLVIRPIERMTALMTKLAADPLAEIQALRRDVFREAYDSDEDNEDDDDIDGEFDDEFGEDDEYMDHTEREGMGPRGRASPGKASRPSKLSSALTDSHSVDDADLRGGQLGSARSQRPDGVAVLGRQRERSAGSRPRTAQGGLTDVPGARKSPGVPQLSMDGVRQNHGGSRLRSESGSARDRRRSASARPSGREGSLSVDDNSQERASRRHRTSGRRLGQRALSAGRTGPQISKFASRRLILADANPVATAHARRSVHGVPAEGGSHGLPDATARAPRPRAASSGRAVRKSKSTATGGVGHSKGSRNATADRPARSGMSRWSLGDDSDGDTDGTAVRTRHRRQGRERKEPDEPKGGADLAAACAAGTGRYVCASLVNLLGGSAEDASKRAQGSYETAQLENAMIKIGGLLQVGFGEAGADIIAQNMGRGQGKLNPLVPGKRVDAIFGFCDIRRFTDATECLQEDVMVFVNTVGQLVHSATHRLGGAANKNIGDAFLLTWKLPRLLNPAEIASKGKDLLLQIQGTTRRDRRVSIDQFVDAMAHSGDAGVALSKLGVMGKQGSDQESRAWESRHPSDLYGEGMASQGRWVHDQFTSSTRVPFGSRGPSAAASLVLASPRRASVDGSATASSPVASELPHTGEMAAAAAGPGAGSARRHSLVPAEVEESMILEDEDEGAAAPLGGHAAAAAASSGESSPVAGRVAPAAAGQHGAAGAWTKEASGTSHGSGWLDPTGGVGDGREDLTRATSACDMTSRDPELPPTGPPGAGPDSHAVAGDSIVDSEAVTESAGSNMPPAVVGSATANSIVARNTDPRAFPSGGASGPAGGTGRVSAASSGGASSSHPASDVVPPVRFLAKQQGGVATPAGVQVHGRSAARPAAAGARLSGGAAGAGDLPHRAQNAEVAGADGADKRPPDAPKLDVPHTRSASLGGGGEGARRSAAGDIAVSALRPSLLASADGIPKHSFSERVGGIGDASGGAVGRRLSMPTGFRHRMTRQSIIEPSAHKDLQHGAGITILDDPTAHAGFQPDAVAARASSKAPLAIRDRDATARTADNALAAFLKVIVDTHNANKRGGVLYPFLRHRAIRRRFGKSFRVELGFGLHLGWAVEGAVGSAYKVDASYLSPHVNLTARLEALTKFYGVPLLISGNFARELSLDAQRYLRLIDRITVKGSRVPIELYTFDITQFPVEFGQLRLNTVARTSAERDANRLLHEDAIHIEFATDPSVLQLQADIPDAFFVSFHAAVRAYIRGDWPEAREQLVETEARYRGAGEDGPTQALLKTMDSLGVGEAKAAPADWKQVHVLDSKTG